MFYIGINFHSCPRALIDISDGYSLVYFERVVLLEEEFRGWSGSI